MAKRHFTPALFAFLRELAANNEKDWWEANKDRYVAQVREPALEFITDFGSILSRISPHFAADARTVGGSLLRPYRDLRFSKDKTPYKTNVGIQFRHDLGKDIHAPGFYLHLEPSGCFAGAGLWHPETAIARHIREKIYDHPGQWKRAAKGKRFVETWNTTPDEDEMLKRVPKGLDPDHPYAEDLRQKSFIAGARLTQKEVTSAGFDRKLGNMFKTASPYVSFLCDAVGVPY